MNEITTGKPLLILDTPFLIVELTLGSNPVVTNVESLQAQFLTSAILGPIFQMLWVCDCLYQ